jgi:hypothetical protein
MIGTYKDAISKSNDEKGRQYRRFYACCFSIFLVVTLFERLLPRRWRYGQADSIENKSIINEAREQTDTFLPSLFMN